MPRNGQNRMLFVGASCCEALFSSRSFREGAQKVLEVVVSSTGAQAAVFVAEGERPMVFPPGSVSLSSLFEGEEGFKVFSSERDGIKTTLGIRKEGFFDEEETLLLSTLCKQLGIALSGFKRREEAEKASRNMSSLYQAVSRLGRAMNQRDLANEICKAAYQLVSPLMVRVKVDSRRARTVVYCPVEEGSVAKGAKKAVFRVREEEGLKCTIEIFFSEHRGLPKTDRKILRLLAEVSNVFLENIELFAKLNDLLGEKERQISHLSILYELGNAYRLTSNPAKRIKLFLQGLTDTNRGLGFPLALYFSPKEGRRFVGVFGVIPDYSTSTMQGSIWRTVQEDGISNLFGSGEILSLKEMDLSLESITPPSMEEPFPLPREVLSPRLIVPEGMMLVGVPLGSLGRELEGFVVVGKMGGFSKEEMRILAMMAQQAALAIASAQSQSTIKELDREFKDAQARFLEAERMATLGELSAKIAHDLKNPLIAIGGLAKKLYKKMADDHPDKRYLEAIIKEVEEGERILSNVLGYVRKPVKIKRKVDLNSILDELLFLFAEDFKDKRVVLVKHLTRDIPQVEVDPGQIRQVLTNLISNAVESMAPLGHGVLKVSSYKKREDGKDWVCVEVEDSGGGIPEETLPSIFEPFFSTKSKGTGLGLAIAKRIVEELHGGKLEVINNPPQGATFVVSLPLKEESLGESGG